MCDFISGCFWKFPPFFRHHAVLQLFPRTPSNFSAVTPTPSPFHASDVLLPLPHCVDSSELKAVLLAFQFKTRHIKENICLASSLLFELECSSSTCCPLKFQACAANQCDHSSLIQFQRSCESGSCSSVWRSCVGSVCCCVFSKSVSFQGRKHPSNNIICFFTLCFAVSAALFFRAHMLPGVVVLNHRKWSPPA